MYLALAFKRKKRNRKSSEKKILFFISNKSQDKWHIQRKTTAKPPPDGRTILRTQTKSVRAKQNIKTHTHACKTSHFHFRFIGRCAHS